MTKTKKIFSVIIGIFTSLLLCIDLITGAIGIISYFSPSSSPAPLTPEVQALMLKADSLLEQKDYEEALPLYGQAIGLAPLLEYPHMQQKIAIDLLSQERGYHWEKSYSELQGYSIDVFCYRRSANDCKGQYDILSKALVDSGFPSAFLKLKSRRKKYLKRHFDPLPQTGINVYFQQGLESGAGKILADHISNIFPQIPVYSIDLPKDKGNPDFVLEVAIVN